MVIYWYLELIYSDEKYMGILTISNLQAMFQLWAVCRLLWAMAWRRIASSMSQPPTQPHIN